MTTAPKSGEFSEGKLWFTRKGSILTLGVTDAAMEEIGEVRGIEFPDKDDDFDTGELVLTVSGSASEVEVITPAAGLVHEINETIKAEPNTLADDPTEEGWLVKLEIQDVSDLKAFVDEDEASSED